MILYPKKYFEKVTDITIEFLNKNKLQGLILDVDNTLIDFDLNLLAGLEEWTENLKNNNIKLCILSNSNKIEKVEKVSKTLNLPYSNFAKKPLKSGFRKVQKILELKSENIGVVGDQIFTDVLGSNRCKMFSILVKPLAKKDIWITVFKRPLENIIIKRYKKQLEKGDN